MALISDGSLQGLQQFPDVLQHFRGHGLPAMVQRIRRLEKLGWHTSDLARQPLPMVLQLSKDTGDILAVAASHQRLW